jgi:hypothetical protein
MSKRADNAIVAARWAHWALVTLCFTSLLAVGFVPRTNTSPALREAIFLSELRDSTETSSVDFLENYGREMAVATVPKPLRDLLGSKGFGPKETLIIQWEESQTIRGVKDALFSGNDGSQAPKDAVSDLYQALVALPPDPVEFSNDTDAYIGSECALQGSTELFLLRHPSEGADGWDGPSYAERQRVWADTRNAKLSDLLEAWDLLQRVYFWFPVGELRPGELRFEHFALDLRLPARLIRGWEKRCADPFFELNALHMPVQMQFRPGSLTPELSDGQVFPALLSMDGSLVTTSGATHNMPWRDWFFIDHDEVPMTAPASVRIPFDAKLHVIDGQKLLLRANPRVGLPRGFAYGNAATSFPALRDFVHSDEALREDTLGSIISRLRAESAHESAASSISLLGFSIPSSRIGAIGVLALLLVFVYLATQLRHLFSIVDAGDGFEETWIGVLEDPLAYVVVLTSVTLLPLATAGALAWVARYELAEVSAIYVILWAVILAPAYLVLVYVCGNLLRKLRHRLFSKESVSPVAAPASAEKLDSVNAAVDQGSSNSEGRFPPSTDGSDPTKQ